VFNYYLLYSFYLAVINILFCDTTGSSSVILLVYPVVCILSDRSGIRVFNVCDRPLDMNNSYSSVTASKSYSLCCYNLKNFNWYGCN